MPDQAEDKDDETTVTKRYRLTSGTHTKNGTTYRSADYIQLTGKEADALAGRIDGPYSEVDESKTADTTDNPNAAMTLDEIESATDKIESGQPQTTDADIEKKSDGDDSGDSDNSDKSASDKSAADDKVTVPTTVAVSTTGSTLLDKSEKDIIKSVAGISNSEILENLYNQEESGKNRAKVLKALKDRYDVVSEKS